MENNYNHTVTEQDGLQTFKPVTLSNNEVLKQSRNDMLFKNYVDTPYFTPDKLDNDFLFRLFADEKFLPEIQMLREYRSKLQQVESSGITIDCPFNDPKSSLHRELRQIFNFEYSQAKTAHTHNKAKRAEHLYNQKWKKQSDLLYFVGSLTKGIDYINAETMQGFSDKLKAYQIENGFSEVDIMTALFFNSQRIPIQ